jgi:hypothetical protein
MSTKEEERKRDQSDGNQKNLYGMRPVMSGFVLRQNASPVFRGHKKGPRPFRFLNAVPNQPALSRWVVRQDTSPGRG